MTYPTHQSAYAREAFLRGTKLPIENVRRLGPDPEPSDEEREDTRKVEGEFVGSMRVLVGKAAEGARRLRFEIVDEKGNCLVWTESPLLRDGDSVTLEGWQSRAKFVME